MNRKTIQYQCEQTAKILAVVLAFFIPISTTITQALFPLIILAMCGAGQWRERAQFLVSHPVIRAGVGLFLIFCIGILYAKVPLSESFNMLVKMSKFLYIPLLMPLFVEEKWRKRAIIAFIVAMVLSLVLGTLKTYGGLPFGLVVGRYHDCAFKNHIDTNLLMSMAVFFLGHLLFSVSGRYLKVGILSLLLLMTFYIFWVSHGRTGYIVFSALWLLWLCQRMTLKQCLVGVSSLILILGATYLTPSQLQLRLSHIVEEIKSYQKGDAGNAEKSVSQRLEFMQSSFDIAKQKLLLGYGTGGFTEAYAKYAKEKNQTPTTNPHNEYLNILVQWGLLGFCAFFTFIWRLFKTSLLLPRNEKYLVQGIVFGILVGCLGNSFLMDFTPGYFFVTFVSITMAALPWQRQQKRSAVLVESVDGAKFPPNKLQEGLAS